MNFVNQVLLTAILFLVCVHVISAMFFPTAYGLWLKKIDDARYEYMVGE